jgi:hypothetical protein
MGRLENTEAILMYTIVSGRSYSFKVLKNAIGWRFIYFGIVLGSNTGFSFF